MVTMVIKGSGSGGRGLGAALIRNLFLEKECYYGYYGYQGLRLRWKRLRGSLNTQSVPREGVLLWLLGVTMVTEHGNYGAWLLHGYQ